MTVFAHPSFFKPHSHSYDNCFREQNLQLKLSKRHAISKAYRLHYPKKLSSSRNWCRRIWSADFNPSWRHQFSFSLYLQSFGENGPKIEIFMLKLVYTQNFTLSGQLGDELQSFGYLFCFIHFWLWNLFYRGNFSNAITLGRFYQKFLRFDHKALEKLINNMLEWLRPRVWCLC